MTDVEHETATLLDELARILGPQDVLRGRSDREFFSTDVFDSGVVAAAVIRPGSIETLARSIAAVTRAKYAVFPRGGGLSYTKGYLPERPNSVVIDTTQLNDIVEVNTTDMYVVVEAGVTWHQLYERLRPERVRTPFFGTGSGLYATVGGTLSQNAMNYGSTRFGPASESVLGLEVVLADGRRVILGSAATPYQPSPFFRGYGPDLVGLFLADNGALGVKATATLRLIRYPESIDYASFDFTTEATFAAALSEIGRSNVASECFGYDPSFLTKRLAVRDLAGDFRRLAGIAKSGRSLLGGVSAAFKVAAAGRRYLEGTQYALHAVVEGRNDTETDAALSLINKIASSHNGKPIPTTLPQVIRATPFGPPNLLLGAGGERWIPVHAVVPHSRLQATMKAMDEYFDSHADVVARHGIDWGYIVLAAGTSGCLIEPAFYWHDIRGNYIEHYLESGFLKNLENHPPDLDARRAVAKIRSDLAQVFMKLGAAHFQIGRFYPYKESRDPTTFELLQHIKGTVDPDNLMNPGALGF